MRTVTEMMSESDSGNGTGGEAIRELEERKLDKNRMKRERRRGRRRERLELEEPNTMRERGEKAATCKSLIIEREEPRELTHNGRFWTGRSTKIFHLSAESEPDVATDASAPRQPLDNEPELEPEMVSAAAPPRFDDNGGVADNLLFVSLEARAWAIAAESWTGSHCFILLFYSKV